MTDQSRIQEEPTTWRRVAVGRSLPQDSFGPEIEADRRSTAVGHVGGIACATGVGLLVCSVADALSRATLAPSPLIFWAGIMLIVLPTFFRLSSVSASVRERLALVCLLGLGLYAVKFLHDPFMFTFPDELAHQFNVDQIVAHHHLFTGNPLLSITARYPGLEGATAAVRDLTGLSDFGAGLLVVGTARLVLMVGLFLLFTKITGSARLGGLGAAIYTANSNFLYFDAQFSYESFALPLLVAVLVAVVEWESRRQSRSPALAWTVLIVLGTAAVVVTHHVSSYALVACLAIASAVQFVIRRRTSARSPWPFAALAVALTGLWLVLEAGPTIGYLSPVIGHAVTSTIRTISGSQTTRHLFSGAGSPAPVGERIVAVSSVVLLAVGLPFGLVEVSRRFRTQPFALLLSGAAILLFATFPLRFAPEAWETANRTEEFLFIGLAFVLACARLAVPTRPHAPWLRRALLTGCFGLVFAGGVIAGWPSSSRLSQPVRVLAGGRDIVSERVALGPWVASHLRGQRFVANATDARVLADYGHAVALTGSTPDYQDIVASASLAPWELAILRDHRARYVVSDQQLNPSLYFSIRDVSAQLVPASAMVKFETAPAARIFDSGQIVIYDVDDRP